MDSETTFHCALEGRLYIANGRRKPGPHHTWYFRTPEEMEYVPFCDDFGPMNISTVVGFIKLLVQQLEMYPWSNVVYLVDKGIRPFTNGVFLIGAYMILILKMEPDEVWKRFQSISLEAYRDATYSCSDFGLTLLDCWRAIKRSILVGWLDTESEAEPGVWGLININKYDLYEDPLNADLVEIVPGKLIAFRGPTDLAGRRHCDDRGFREFSPEHYLDIFAQLNVKTVVMLNEARYDRTAFEAQGIKRVELYFDDCTSPTPWVISEFFRVVDRASAAGTAVAVHCKAGLGRTGTLIALHIMRSHGFSAREAIAWLRIMRPGAVIGEQQHFLCHYERQAQAVAHHILIDEDKPSGGGGCSGGGGGGEGVCTAAAGIFRVSSCRGRKRVSWSLSTQSAAAAAAAAAAAEAAASEAAQHVSDAIERRAAASAPPRGLHGLACRQDHDAAGIGAECARAAAAQGAVASEAAGEVNARAAGGAQPGWLPRLFRRDAAARRRGAVAPNS